MNALKLSAALLLAGAATPALAASNPMNFVGETHNQYLACLQANSVPGISPLITLVRKCGVKPDMPLRDFVATFRPAVEGDPAMPLAERMLPYRHRYSDYEYGFFDRIDQVTTHADTQEQATRMLTDLEAEAIANLDVKTFSGQSILAGIAVARHSLDFWVRYEPLPEDASQERKLARWLRALVVAAADVGGAMLGASLGAQPWMAGIVSSAASSFANNALAPADAP